MCYVMTSGFPLHSTPPTTNRRFIAPALEKQERESEELSLVYALIHKNSLRI